MAGKDIEEAERHGPARVTDWGSDLYNTDTLAWSRRREFRTATGGGIQHLHHMPTGICTPFVYRTSRGYTFARSMQNPPKRPTCCSRSKDVDTHVPAQIYLRSGSIRSNNSMLFSYMVNTMPPLIISRASRGSAPLQKVNNPSCLKMMAAQRNELP